MESEVQQGKHNTSNNLFESAAVYFDCYLTLTMSNNCAFNATQHEGN